MITLIETGADLKENKNDDNRETGISTSFSRNELMTLSCIIKSKNYIVHIQPKLDLKSHFIIMTQKKQGYE